MAGPFILLAVRNSLSVPDDSTLAIDTLKEDSFIAVETTAKGERKYMHGTYGRNWVKMSEPVDLDLQALHAYDKLKKLAAKALVERKPEAPVYLLDPRAHPDVFQPEYAGYSVFGWAHEHTMPALHALDDELMHEGLQMRLQSLDSPDELHLWLAPVGPRPLLR